MRPKLMQNLKLDPNFNMDFIRAQWLGLVSMPVAQEIQTELLNQQDSNAIYVLGCEHETVVSVGRSLWKSLETENTTSDGLFYYPVSRGGKLTIHNPGQLVIYPVFNIKKYGLSVKSYLKLLFEVTRQTFMFYELDLTMDFEKNYGLYINSKKIVSAGLSYSKGWVSQGLSINLNNDLKVFEKIDICGMKCMQMASAKETLNTDLNLTEFYNLWLTHFSNKLSALK